MNHLDALWNRWVASADLEALGELFDETAPGLRRLASFMARDAAAADDALQSTYLAALERRQALGEDGRVEAWLAGILVRQVRRQHRAAAQARLQGVGQGLGQESGAVAGDGVLASRAAAVPTPAGLAAGVEFEERVTALIDGLPENYAVPLRRKLLRGDSAQVIAVDLGLEPSTVHTRISRGLAQLRKVLPAGFAAPALAGASSSRSAGALGPMRAHVLAHAKGHAARAAGTLALGSGTSWLILLGGLACLVSLAVIGSRWWPAKPSAEAPIATLVERGPDAAVRPRPEGRPAPEPHSQERREIALAHRGVRETGAALMRWSGTVVPRIAGVRVHLLEADTLRPLDLLATTEEGGRFSFTGSAHLERQIGFFLEGHTVWASPLSGGQQQRADRDSSRRVEGQTIRFGDPRLLPGAAVSGRVQDSRGAPVAGATLYATSRRMLAADQHDRPFGVTALDGSFALDSVVAHESAGQVLFGVAPDGRTGWTLFACPGGKREIKDLELTVHDVFAGRVEVLDEDSGEPIAGARVTLSPATGRPFEHAQSGRALMLESRTEHFFLGRALDAAWSANTGADGWAELSTIPAVPGQGIQVEGIQPFACWVTATAPGYEVAPSQVLRWFPEPNALSEAPGWRDLISGTVSLRMQRSREANLGVTGSDDGDSAASGLGAAPLSVRFVDEAGVGLDGFRVTAVQGNRRLGRGGLWNGGRWSWPEADAGDWSVEVYDPLVMRDFRRSPIHTVVLKGGPEEHLVRIQRPLPDPAGQVTLELRAIDTLESLDPTSWDVLRQQDDGRFRGEPVADLRALGGALRLEDLPPGSWWIKVRARGYAESELRFELFDGEDRVLQIDLSPVEGR